jgi:hypothetical protein
VSAGARSRPWHRVVAALSLTILALGLGDSTSADVQRPDVAVWVYGAERWAGDQIAIELSHLPAGARRVYLSVEDGPRFLLDDPAAAARLSDVLDVAGTRFGLAVEAMVLQDTRWIADVHGAERRVSAVLRFDESRRRAGRPGFDGLHFDVEPYTDEAWTCGSEAERAAIVDRLHTLFDHLAAITRQSAAGPMRITAAFPWWIGAMSGHVPRMAPRAWLSSLDEVVLMAYGDPGGPMVGGSAATVSRRLNDARLWSGVPSGRGVRVGLATHEYPDPGAFSATIREVSDQLGSRAEFRGIAVFAHGHVFNGPITGSLEGRVSARDGTAVAGAVVRVAEQASRTTKCGTFSLRGLAAGDIEIAVSADGFVDRRVVARDLVPGRILHLPGIVLDRRS